MLILLNVFFSAMFGFMGSWSVVMKHWFMAVVYYLLAGVCYFVVWSASDK